MHHLKSVNCETIIYHTLLHVFFFYYQKYNLRLKYVCSFEKSGNSSPQAEAGFPIKKNKKARELTRTLMISYSQNIYNLKYYNFLLS